MLNVDIFQDPQGNIKAQYNTDTPKDIKALQDCLRLLEIRNPLCSFAVRQKGGFYDNLTEYEIQRDAWVADTLSAFWKKADDDPGQPQMNAFAVLARMTDAYLAEHEELLELREKVQQLSSRREKKRLSRKRVDNDIPDVFTADPSFETDEDEKPEFIDYLSFGVGLQAQRYSDFLKSHKNTDNDIYFGNGDYYGISDYAVITYEDSEKFRQTVNIYFYDTEEQSKYTVSVTVDNFADDEFDYIEDIFEHLQNNITISIPYSKMKNIELEIAAIDGPCHLLSGIKVSYDLSITVPEDGIDEVQMQKIYTLTGAIQSHICNAIMKTKRK